MKLRIRGQKDRVQATRYFFCVFFLLLLLIWMVWGYFGYTAYGIIKTEKQVLYPIPMIGGINEFNV